MVSYFINNVELRGTTEVPNQVLMHHSYIKYLILIVNLFVMGPCQSSTDEGSCWPCARRKQEKIFEYQNIFGSSDSQSCRSRPFSKHSLMIG